MPRTRTRGPSAQQKLVLDIVQSSDRHPSAVEIFLAARRTMPTISLATVYRNLRALAAAGAVHERRFDGVARFDPCTRPHSHLVCVACGRIGDIEPDERTLRRAVRGDAAAWVVQELDLEVRGLCPTCRRRAPAGGRPAGKKAAGVT